VSEQIEQISLNREALLKAIVTIRDLSMPGSQVPTWQEIAEGTIRTYLVESGVWDKAEQWDAAQPMLDAMQSVCMAAQEVVPTGRGAVTVTGKMAALRVALNALVDLSNDISGANPQKGDND
jgi:hypothetical protein